MDEAVCFALDVGVDLALDPDPADPLPEFKRRAGLAGRSTVKDQSPGLAVVGQGGVQERTGAVFLRIESPVGAVPGPGLGADGAGLGGGAGALAKEHDLLLLGIPAHDVSGGGRSRGRARSTAGFPGRTRARCRAAQPRRAARALRVEWTVISEAFGIDLLKIANELAAGAERDRIVDAQHEFGSHIRLNSHDDGSFP